MKVIYLMAVLIAGSFAILQADATPVLVAGWAGNSDLSYQETSSGITGGVTQASVTAGAWGNYFPSTYGDSADETYGSLTNATAPANDEKLRTKQAGDVYLDFVVQNGSTESCDLTGFSFDAWRDWAGACANGYELSVVGGSSIQTGGLTVMDGSPGAGADYEDIDISFSTSLFLDSGESVTFRLAFLGNSGGANVNVDNVAVIGVVPEPEPEPEPAAHLAISYSDGSIVISSTNLSVSAESNVLQRTFGMGSDMWSNVPPASVGVASNSWVLTPDSMVGFFRILSY